MDKFWCEKAVCVCFTGTITNMTFAVGIALFALLGFYIRPWRNLTTAVNCPGVLLFFFCMCVRVY